MPPPIRMKNVGWKKRILMGLAAMLILACIGACVARNGRTHVILNAPGTGASVNWYSWWSDSTNAVTDSEYPDRGISGSESLPPEE